MPFAAEHLEQPLVVDVEAQGPRRRVKVGPVDEQADLFLWVEIHNCPFHLRD
jgi:hypothetical protein